MTLRKPLPILILLALILIPATLIQAQSATTLENSFGEGSFMDGYDFSASAVQRWGEQGSDTPNLAPDFYLGDNLTPVSTPDYHSPKSLIDYGKTPLTSITEIPDPADSRFGTYAFALGHTYGLFTNEGDYVVLNILDSYQQSYGDDIKNGVAFNWKLLEGETGEELTLAIYPLDRPEFALGDSPTIAGDVLVGGQPLEDASVCPEVTSDSGEVMFGACFTTDAYGQFAFQLVYGTHIPLNYRGKLIVWANVVHKEQAVEQTIYIPYGSEAFDDPMQLELFGPTTPVVVSDNAYIEIGGTLTSNGVLVDEADVQIKVNNQTFKTKTGVYDPGKFYYSWETSAFPAGNVTVFITITKLGYQTVSGQISFILAGEGYDYWVTMDPIPSLLPPGSQLSLPGTLTLGGARVSDWVELDITYPNGRVETYSYLTDADGRFSHLMTSLTELGAYQFAVFHHPDRKPISNLYSFTVGETYTPTPSIELIPTLTPMPITWEIVEVQYLPQAEMGDSIIITGKLVYYQGGQTYPAAGVPILANGVIANYQSVSQAGPALTYSDGSFTINLDATSFHIDTMVLRAVEEEQGPTIAHWFGPLKVVLPIDPIIVMEETDYDQGEIIDGLLKLQPVETPEDWNAGLQIIYQVVGPIGGAEKLYIFEPEDPHTYGSGHFYWKVPDRTEAGTYRITAHINGLHIPSSQVEAEFSVNGIRATVLTALMEPSDDGWISGDLLGLFTDFEGAPIPGANIRVDYYEKDEPHREFSLTGTGDADGRFRINLQPLDIFSAEGHDDPWKPRHWTTTVYADKQGYATGATLLDIQTPSIEPLLEIVSIDPPLDFLSAQAENGLNIEDLLDMQVIVVVRYNNIFEDGAKLSIGSRGNWAVHCMGENVSGNLVRKAYLEVNGEVKPAWDHSLNGNKYLNFKTWALPDTWSYYYYYPSFGTQIDAFVGPRQESRFVVSGKLFGYHYSDGSPNQCGGAGYSEAPNLPPGWIGSEPAVTVWARLGTAYAEAHYNIEPPGISASGTAWVSATDGVLKLNLGMEDATGYKLADHPVQLSIVAKDILTEDTIPEKKITVQSSATTDGDGKLEVPLTAKSNPCDFELEARYFVVVSSTSLPGEKLIPIELRCVADLTFEIDQNGVFLLQAMELPQDQPYRLAAGKEVGVRVYLKVDGEIYQPDGKPLDFGVKAELLQPGTDKPLIPQTKTVSLTRKGASVRWNDPARAENQAGIGEVAEWEDSPSGLVGREVIPIDFIFTPSAPAGKSGTFTIRISVDPDGAYGEKLERQVDGKVQKMKTLRLIFVPVDIYALDTSFIYEQANFLMETYPLGYSNLVMELHDIYTTDQLPKACISLTYLKRIACGLGSAIGTSGDTNNPVRIVGIVESSTWLTESYAVMKTLGIDSALGAYAPEVWDSTTNNVVLVRYPENVMNTTAHEIGHSFWLEPDEQYKTDPPHGLPIHGLVLRDAGILDIAADWNDNTNSKWKKGTSFAGATEVYDLMGNPGYQINQDDDSITLILGQQPWVVHKTWEALFEALADPPGGEVFAFQGVIGEDGTASLYPLVRTQGVPDEVSEVGDYQLQIQSSSGEVLFSNHFGQAGATGIFQLLTPYTPGLGRVVLLQDETVLSEMVRSLNPPEVTFNDIPDEVGPETPLNLSWTGSDPDGDHLTYNLTYCCEQGVPWVPLANNLSVSSYIVDARWLPGGVCNFRLVASDGLNASETVSKFFSFPPNSPQVEILTEEAVYPSGETLLLQGLASDLSDGVLLDKNLRWSSSLDGELGTGRSLPAVLSPGQHTITLQAQDFDGNISLAQVEVVIEEGTLYDRQLTSESAEADFESKDNLTGYFFIAALALGGFLLGGAGLGLFMLLRSRQHPAAVRRSPSGKAAPPPPVQIAPPPPHAPKRQPKVIQDSRGTYWHQDPRTKAWYFWNGRTWQSTPTPPPGKRRR